MQRDAISVLFVFLFVVMKVRRAMPFRIVAPDRGHKSNSRSLCNVTVQRVTHTTARRWGGLPVFRTA
jgi:hypothetical protein